MANNYIYLASSDNSIAGKVRILLQNYSVVINKKQTIQETANGGLDVTQGKVRDTHIYIARVRWTETESGYLSYSQLESLYRLNNPKGTPSSILKFRDHYYTGTPPYDEKSVVMVGEFARNVMGVEIDNDEAWFMVKIQLMVL